MASPAKIVHDQLFNGATPPGAVNPALLRLVLLLVNAVNPNASPGANPPQQVADYVDSLVGPEDHAAVFVKRQLNTLADRYSRGSN